MSRKAGSVPEDTRQSLIRSAREVIWEKGYDAAALREICRRAGVTTGALYLFFQDKEDLFRQMLEPVARVIGESMQHHYQLEDEGEAIIGEAREDLDFARAILGLHDCDPQMYDIIVRNHAHPVVSEYMDGIMEMMDRHTAQLLHLDMSDGVVARAVHWFSVLQIEAVMGMTAVQGDPDDRDRQMEIMIRMLRGALLALHGAVHGGDG